LESVRATLPGVLLLAGLVAVVLAAGSSGAGELAVVALAGLTTTGKGDSRVWKVFSRLGRLKLCQALI